MPAAVRKNLAEVAELLEHEQNQPRNLHELERVRRRHLGRHAPRQATFAWRAFTQILHSLFVERFCPRLEWNLDAALGEILEVIAVPQPYACHLGLPSPRF